MAEGRLGFGYNGDRWLVTLNTRSFAFINELDGSNPMGITYTNGQLSVGYRFKILENRPKFLKLTGL